MPSFQDILTDINTGLAAAQNVLPTVSQNGIASVQSISAITATAGATAASLTKDQGTQNEIIAASQTALALIPFLFSLFHHAAQNKAGQPPAQLVAPGTPSA